MNDDAQYFAHGLREPFHEPSGCPPCCGVHSGSGDGPQIGTAYRCGHFGKPGFRSRSDEPYDAVWRLVVGGETLDGQWILSEGEWSPIEEW